MGRGKRIKKSRQFVGCSVFGLCGFCNSYLLHSNLFFVGNGDVQQWFTVGTCRSIIWHITHDTTVLGRSYVVFYGIARGSNLSVVWEHGWLKSYHELQTGCQELQTYISKILYISMILYVHYNMYLFFFNLTFLNIFDTIQHFHLWLFYLCSTHPAVFGR